MKLSRRTLMAGGAAGAAAVAFGLRPDDRGGAHSEYFRQMGKALVDAGLVRPVAGMATARAVPGARLVMYPDMAHDMPPVRVPELTDEVLVNFARAPITAARVPAPA